MTGNAISRALEALTAEVRAMRADLAARFPDARFSPDDRALLERLLPGIAGAIGSEAFAAADLVDEPALRALLRGRSAKSIGRLLARADGRPIVAGYVVRRHDARTWEVLAVSAVSNRF